MMTAEMALPWEVRALDGADAPQVASVARVSKATAMPWLPVLHSPAEDVAFYRGELTGSAGWGVDVDGRLAGFALVRDGWLNHLYVAPQAQGRGIGTALLERALDAGAALDLWAFEDNHRALGFYRSRGFVEVERTDGAGNEERTPDVRLRWSSDAPGCRVRPARPDDADGIAVVHTSAWQQAYAGLLPQDALDALDWRVRRDWWRTHLLDPEDDRFVDLVAVTAGTVVGFASLGPPRDDDLPAEGRSWIEMYALYVAPGQWGRGVGGALWRRARTAVPATTDAVVLWVLRDNLRARAFYVAVGLEPDGTERDREIGGRLVPEVRYATVLTRT